MYTEYMDRGLYELGRLASERISLYYNNTDTSQKILAELYSIMIALGTKMLYKDETRLEEYRLDETIHSLAGDLLLSITKNPKKFYYQDNFFLYYKAALRNRAFLALRDVYYMDELQEIDKIEYEKEYTEFIPYADMLLIKKDNCKTLINRVEKVTSMSARFSSNYGCLTWPIIFCIFNDDNRLFDSLDFKDRVNIRILIQKIKRKIPFKLYG